jgi:hypothetical protein
MMSSFSLDFDLINMADDNVVGQNKWHVPIKIAT